MEDYLYRFRTISRLLGENCDMDPHAVGELHKLEIYFASPEQLNDPLEGYKNIHWCGDIIVWKNLIRHYIICHAWQYLKCCDPNESLESRLRIDIDCTIDDFVEELRKPIQSIVDQFFSAPFIDEYIRTICRNNRTVRRGELEVHLVFLHPFIRYLTQFKLWQGGILNDTHKPAETNRNKLFELILRTIKVAPSLSDQELTNFLEKTVYTFVKKDSIVRSYTTRIDTKRREDMFVGLHFPEEFCNMLEKLMYPSWYAACFLKDSKNSSLWGSYADGHRGVCLKYKVDSNSDGYTFDLNLPDASETLATTPTKVKFHKVTYGSKYLDVNFFTSMAGINKDELYKHWYASDNKTTSICSQWLADLGGVEAVSHQENFTHSYTVKLQEWGAEQEYRIVLSTNAHELASPKSRKISYPFEQLEGVIFGIRTSLYHKIKIMTLLKDHCEENKTSINIYQAHYDSESNEIDYELVHCLP